MSLGWIGGHVLGNSTSRPIKLDGPQDTALTAALLQKEQQARQRGTWVRNSRQKLKDLSKASQNYKQSHETALRDELVRLKEEERRIKALITKARKYSAGMAGGLHADELVDFRNKKNFRNANSGLLEDQQNYYIELVSQIKRLEEQFAVQDQLDALDAETPQVTPTQFFEQEHSRKQADRRRQLMLARSKKRNFSALRVSQPGRQKSDSTEMPPPMFAKPSIKKLENMLDGKLSKNNEDGWVTVRQGYNRDDPLTKDIRRKPRNLPRGVRSGKKAIPPPECLTRNARVIGRSPSPRREPVPFSNNQFTGESPYPELSPFPKAGASPYVSKTPQTNQTPFSQGRSPYPNQSPYSYTPYGSTPNSYGAKSPYFQQSPYPGTKSPYPGQSPYPGIKSPYPGVKSPYPQSTQLDTNVVESKVIGVVKENTKIVIKRKREDGEIVPTKRVKPEKPTLTDILPKVSNAKPEMRKRDETDAPFDPDVAQMPNLPDILHEDKNKVITSKPDPTRKFDPKDLPPNMLPT